MRSPLELVREAMSIAEAATLRSKKAVAASSQVNTMVDHVICELPNSVLFGCLRRAATAQKIRGNGRATIKLIEKGQYVLHLQHPNLGLSVWNRVPHGFGNLRA